MVGVLEGSLEQVQTLSDESRRRELGRRHALVHRLKHSVRAPLQSPNAQIPSTLVESRAATSPRSSVLRRQPAARKTQLQSAINLRCNLTTSPLGNYGNCGDLHISYNETAERDVRDAGPEFVVDHDLAARVERDAHRVELEIVRVWPAADRDDHVRAKVTLIGKSGRTKSVPRTSLCSSARRVRRCRDVVRCQMPRLRAPS
jgi:hypothetical protein